MNFAQILDFSSSTVLGKKYIKRVIFKWFMR